MHHMSHRRFPCFLLLAAAIAALPVASARGEEANERERFVVADVHASPHATNNYLTDVSGGLMRGGDYHLRRATMVDLIHLAYDLDAKKIIGGPAWLGLDRFEVHAKVPAGTTAETVRPMLRALLAERFALVVHNDTKPVPAWVLTAGKHPEIRQSEQSDNGNCHGKSEGEFISVACRATTMKALAEKMSQLPGTFTFVGDNVTVDQTGLNGTWDFDLKFSRRFNTTAAAPEIVSLFDALEKVGLHLDPGTVPLPVVVVDSVNRTPTPNSPEVEKSLPPPPTEFEVADVRPSDPEKHDEDMNLQPGGRFDAHGLTLRAMIGQIWGLPDDMIAGAPKFADQDRWDIVAKAPEVMAADGDFDVDPLFAMVKNLLAERFGLKFHFEDRPVAAYTMTAPKPKMRKADPNSRSGCEEGPPTLVKVDPRATTPVLGRLMTCTNVTMAYLADQLPVVANGYVHSAVLDKTGLEGGWDFTLSFSTIGQLTRGNTSQSGSQGASDPNGAISLGDAMEKQLGLKLELQKRPVPVMVIDHIEQKPTDN